jgi:F-type H+-transporting ATPase subunit b
MATETATEVNGAAEASSGGMPQLDFSTWGNQIFWLVLALIAIYLILSRVALPRIAAILAERLGTISNDVAAAEDLRAKAAKAEAAYDKALIDARAEAQRIIGTAKADMQTDLDKAIAAADDQISAKSAESEKAISEIRAGAVENVKVVAKDTVKEIVSALGGQADAATITAAVTSRMKG